MNLKRLLPIPILLILSIHAYSQPRLVQARVMDSESMEPVEFVTVYTSITKGSISDELGYFKLLLSEDQKADSLHISCIGYQEKTISLKDLNLDAVDTIFLSPLLIELDAVEVAAKFKKAPKSRQIIKDAITAIPRNYPDQPILYEGYYREYIKEQENYINLLESIIKLEDSGINSPDVLSAGFLFKRVNQDFSVDMDLARPYDNIDKLVPYTSISTALNNELSILRSHDPVRNFDRPALYFIDCLKTDFIRNHDFSEPKITYLNDRPYYYIAFKDIMDRVRGITRIFGTGSIYIDATNNGIKKINYAAIAEEGINQQKLFELNVEYQPEGEKYRLNYLSFNNLFKTRNFYLLNKKLEINTIELTFNRHFDPVEAMNIENYRVFWKEEEIEVKRVDLYEEGKLVRLILAGGKDILQDKMKARLNQSLFPDKINDEDNPFFKDDLRVDIINLTDLEGNPLMPVEFDDHYQYREFFVKDFTTENTAIMNNLIDRQRPVFSSMIFGPMTADTLWLNTPLITEKTASTVVKIDNKAFKSGLESLYYKNLKTKSDIVYLHTDREVYSPEDTLYFKAYVRDREDLQGSGLSKTLYVKLVDAKGNIASGERFFIEDSETSGQFLLSHKLEEGLYFLTASSSWMHNFDTDQLYSRRILIKKEKREGFQLVASYDRNDYFPGDTMKVKVQCYDELNQEIEGVNYTYRFLSGENILERDKSATSASMAAIHQLIIPAGLTAPLVIKLDAIYRGQVLDTTYSLPVNYDLLVDFYPEGGQSIRGLVSRVAVKSQTPKGRPVNIKADIMDQHGTIVTSFNSEYDGMGVFTYLPSGEQKLEFHITHPAGIEKHFPLPASRNDGWQLSARSTGDKISLFINRRNTKSDTALVTVMVRGYLCYYQQIIVENGRSLEIASEDIPPGIAVITLFDNQMVPQAERLLYINTTGEASTVMSTDRNTYVPRDKVSLDLRISQDIVPRLKGSFSLSVVDDQLCSVDFIDEPDIRSSFLLSPEIKGKIHHPNYYLGTNNIRVQQHLDLLLMTQGWRSYSHIDKNLWANKVKEPEDREIISGRLMRQPLGKELTPAAGDLSIIFAGNSVKLPVSESGIFSFKPEYDLESNSGVFIAAKDKRGTHRISIDLDSTYFEQKLSNYLHFLSDSLNKSTEIHVLTYKSISDQFSLGLKDHEWIEEVVIRKTVERKELDVVDMVVDKRSASPEQLNSAVNMEDLMENVFRVSNVFDKPVLMVVDGYYEYMHTSDESGEIVLTIDNEHAMFLRPADIAEYTVMQGPELEAIYGWGIQYVIEIKTKHFLDIETESPWTNPVSIKKYAVVKDFYKPVYDTEVKRRSILPDLRKTIHWDPDFRIEENGKASVEFYNGDRYTKIKCILEGITDEGVPVHAEHFYNVSLQRDE